MLHPQPLPDYSNPNAVPTQHASVYADNGGSVIAIAGDDFVVIGADTRLSTGYSIFTRHEKKLFPLTATTILGSSGCWCDTVTLTRILKLRMQMYEQEHNQVMSTPACAQMLSTMMYYKRFFPYYVSNVLVGFDTEGKGCVFSYDPIGHCEKSEFKAGGSAGVLLQPLLDNQIGHSNMDKASREPLTLEKALTTLKDTFISAAERDIHTGDSVLINVITKDGIKEEIFELRKD